MGFKWYFNRMYLWYEVIWWRPCAESPLTVSVVNPHQQWDLVWCSLMEFVHAIINVNECIHRDLSYFSRGIVSWKMLTFAIWEERGLHQVMFMLQTAFWWNIWSTLTLLGPSGNNIVLKIHFYHFEDSSIIFSFLVHKIVYFIFLFVHVLCDLEKGLLSVSPKLRIW